MGSRGEDTARALLLTGPNMGGEPSNPDASRLHA